MFGTFHFLSAARKKKSNFSLVPVISCAIKISPSHPSHLPVFHSSHRFIKICQYMSDWSSVLRQKQQQACNQQLSLTVISKFMSVSLTKTHLTATLLNNISRNMSNDCRMTPLSLPQPSFQHLTQTGVLLYIVHPLRNMKCADGVTCSPQTLSSGQTLTKLELPLTGGTGPERWSEISGPESCHAEITGSGKQRQDCQD